MHGKGDKNEGMNQDASLEKYYLYILMYNKKKKIFLQ